MQLIQPYSDEYMTYDKKINRYKLTPKAILDYFGEDMQEEAKDEVYADILIDEILRAVSANCYTYMHSFSMKTRFQDDVIAKTEEGRQLIFDAMIAQFPYVRANGDLTNDADPERAKNYMKTTAKEVFERPLDCLGGNLIIYSGC